ncbi:hypothetical protein [Kitasatospora camelliae]|uniref:Uncharacterized protein n=1 Tax=Kitasatospora camelliae TaxID=3156397 RepID=A0AAU8K766_9ACTN
MAITVMIEPGGPGRGGALMSGSAWTGGAAAYGTVHAAPVDVPLTRTLCEAPAAGMSEWDMRAPGGVDWYPQALRARVCEACDQAVQELHLWAPQPA